MNKRELIYRDEVLEALDCTDSCRVECLAAIRAIPAVVLRNESGSSLGKNKASLLTQHPE